MFCVFLLTSAHSPSWGGACTRSDFFSSPRWVGGKVGVGSSSSRKEIGVKRRKEVILKNFRQDPNRFGVPCEESQGTHLPPRFTMRSRWACDTMAHKCDGRYRGDGGRTLKSQGRIHMYIGQGVYEERRQREKEREQKRMQQNQRTKVQTGGRRVAIIWQRRRRRAPRGRGHPRGIVPPGCALYGRTVKKRNHGKQR